MPAYMFINDIIKPVLAIGLVFAVPLLAVWDWLLEMRQVKQEAQPQEVQQYPDMAQRVRFCPYHDVHEEANRVAFDAWQQWKVK